jgi:hypothetical protein
VFYLTTHSPLAAGPEGFLRREGRAYLPGAALREALLSAALAYAVRRDEAFAAEMRRMAQHAFKGSAGELAEAMIAALLERQPELAALSPDDVPVAEPQERAVQVLDTWRGEPASELRLELVEGRFPVGQSLPPELETWLAAAGRSYAEALATAELEALRGVQPGVEAFFEELKARRFKGPAWPLRLGFWTPEPEGGRFLPFARLAAADRALERRFRVRPLPRRLLYDPVSARTLGWATLEKEG